MEKDVSASIIAFAKENDFNGTVLVRKSGKTVCQESFGWTNMDQKSPITVDWTVEAKGRFKYRRKSSKAH